MVGRTLAHYKILEQIGSGGESIYFIGLVDCNSYSLPKSRVLLRSTSSLRKAANI